MSNANTIQQRLQDLLITTPSLTSDEISAVNDAYSLIDELTTERDEYKQRMQRLMRSQFEITKERDAYEKCADTMAAAPELLKALISLERLAGKPLMHAEQARIDARAAIAKATGVKS